MFCVPRIVDVSEFCFCFNIAAGLFGGFSSPYEGGTSILVV